MTVCRKFMRFPRLSRAVIWSCGRAMARGTEGKPAPVPMSRTLPAEGRKGSSFRLSEKCFIWISAGSVIRVRFWRVFSSRRRVVKAESFVFIIDILYHKNSPFTRGGFCILACVIALLAFAAGCGLGSGGDEPDVIVEKCLTAFTEGDMNKFNSYFVSDFTERGLRQGVESTVNYHDSGTGIDFKILSTTYIPEDELATEIRKQINYYSDEMSNADFAYVGKQLKRDKITAMCKVGMLVGSAGQDLIAYDNGRNYTITVYCVKIDGNWKIINIYAYGSDGGRF